MDQNYEQNYEQHGVSNQTPDNNRSDKHANLLCIISLVCMLLPIIISFVFMCIRSVLTYQDTAMTTDIIAGVLGTISILLVITGLILMIYVRVQYPKNVFGKVLMWLYIILAIIALILFVLYMLFAMVALLSCFSCLAEMPG